jgi:hypothetical protein
MLALDLLRRAYERRYFMPSGQPEVDDFGSGVAIGTDDKYLHDSRPCHTRPGRPTTCDRRLENLARNRRQLWQVRELLRIRQDVDCPDASFDRVQSQDRVRLPVQVADDPRLSRTLLVVADRVFGSIATDFEQFMP